MNETFSACPRCGFTGASAPGVFLSVFACLECGTEYCPRCKGNRCPSCASRERVRTGECRGAANHERALVRAA